MATLATPCGPFTVFIHDGAVVASGWTEDPSILLAPLPTARRPTGWTVCRDLGPVTEAVGAYLAGRLDAIDDVAVRQRSGPFVELAWAALRAVPAGAPVSYRHLAAASGRPDAARAAGRACGTNAVGLFVPCHRALRRDGGLGGYRWGLEVKRWLLAHEAAAKPLFPL